MTQIAIDGPGGAGKSTLSRRLAAELGYVYVDTGALYRAVGLAAMRRGISAGDGAAVAGLLPGLDVSLSHEGGRQRVLLNGEDVSEAVRGEAVGMAASAVSAHAAVRAFLLETQRRIARRHNVIMDGRDIGTVVLPDAQIKIFLTADAGVRARRRYDELRAKGEAADYEAVLRDVQKRDYDDSHRAAAPLAKADDAVLADTTECDFECAFEMLLRLVRERLPG